MSAHPILTVDPLFLIIGGLILVGAIFMLWTRISRIRFEAQTLIDIKARMVVVTRIRGEYLAETKTLGKEHEFYLIRHAHRMIICRDCSTGEMFFIRDFEYVEALQEGRIKESYRAA